MWSNKANNAMTDSTAPEFTNTQLSTFRTDDQIGRTRTKGFTPNFLTLAIITSGYANGNEITNVEIAE